MTSDWHFLDPEETEVITLERILRGESHILLVTHDMEDSGWQFLDGEQVFEDDGVVVCLGEIVQFDPELKALAELPAGCYAWRSSPGQIWSWAAGEPATDRPNLPGYDQNREAWIGRNIEIKARVPDLEQVRGIVESLSETEVEILDHEDIFFSAPDGRLKLRILDEITAELIHYHRPDTSEPKASRYLIAPTSAPVAMKTILSRVLPIAGVVRKRRWLYRAGQTRIHLDRVEGLGDFVELEVVLRLEQSEEEGVEIAEELMNRLAISREQLVPTAYIDLMPHP
jgi:predicted adenylyl cyclase CyaB